MIHIIAFLGLLCGLFTVYVAVISSSKRFRLLAQFPGPWWAPYSRLWLVRTVQSGHSQKYFVDVNRKHGHMARIGPNHLLTDNPDFVRHILSAHSKYTRGPWYDSMRIDPHVPNIVSERNVATHHRLRYQMSAGYAGKDIEGVEAAVDERLAEFFSHLESSVSKPGSTKTLDIATRLQYYAVDVISQLCFGRPLGFVQSDSDHIGFQSTVEWQMPIVMLFSVIVELNSLYYFLSGIPWIRKVIVPSAGDKIGIGPIMKISREVINERCAPGAVQKKDMLGSFIKRGLSPTDVEMEISISLIAGSDTTATALRACLLAIISNPRVFSKLVKEIDEAIVQGKISSPIRESEAKTLPYLQAVIKEGLRRFSPITQLRERVVPPSGDTFDGKSIPAGTFVGINSWGIQLHPVFGEDPEVFRPERWLIDDQDKLQQMNQVYELIFGWGTTRCLGIPIALMNLNKIFVELFRRYDIELVNAQNPWSSICFGIFFQKDFNVRISHRLSGTA
ncbi:putative benzoate 4-monooxygenase cytochrome P450 [Whalleya microplaca]|nr:putative benzoate 4-monooxygenase cytochrome P450 [Whalleya microplaca]